MNYKATLTAVATALAACGYSQTLSGSMTWTSGTLAQAITIENGPITIILDQLSSSGVYHPVTFPNTFVTGPSGTTMPAGTPLEFMEANSTPFASSYLESRNMVVFNPTDAPGVTRRVVPISSNGALSYNVATAWNQPGTRLVFDCPPNNPISGSILDMSVYGLSVSFNVEIASYSLNLPNPTSFSTSFVTFPYSAPAMNVVNFTCAGNGTMTFQGANTSNTVEAVGQMTQALGNTTGYVSIISGATLSFLTGQ